MTGNQPLLAVMGDYQNINPATKPKWGAVGSWRWYEWRKINPAEGVFDFSTIDADLDVNAKMGKPVAISVIPYPGLNLDTTPAWVYAKAPEMRGKGWAGTGTKGTTFTYPAWNLGAWDGAWRSMIFALGAKYDKDPRVHSVWACTGGFYGETVLDYTNNSTGEKFSLNNHNPGLHFSNTLQWYHQAFPSKPMFPIITGNVDRLNLAKLAISLGRGIKLNGLRHDGPMQQQQRPTPGGGTYEVARMVGQAGFPVAYEHAWNKMSVNEAYWSMLCGLSSYMTIFDGEIEHLDRISEIEGFWELLLHAMSQPLDQFGLYVARDTIHDSNGWEGGWSGPWERGITANAKCYAPGTTEYRAAPLALTGTMYGYGGIGWCQDSLGITLSLPEGRYDLCIIYAGEGTDQWDAIIRYGVESPGIFRVGPGNYWLHRVTAYPAETKPVPPEETETLEEKFVVLDDEVRVLFGKVADLQADLQQIKGTLAHYDAILETLKDILA